MFFSFHCWEMGDTTGLVRVLLGPSFLLFFFDPPFYQWWNFKDASRRCTIVPQTKLGWFETCSAGIDVLLLLSTGWCVKVRQRLMVSTTKRKTKSVRASTTVTRFDQICCWINIVKLRTPDIEQSCLGRYIEGMSRRGWVCDVWLNILNKLTETEVLE